MLFIPVLLHISQETFQRSWTSQTTRESLLWWFTHPYRTPFVIPRLPPFTREAKYPKFWGSQFAPDHSLLQQAQIATRRNDWIFTSISRSCSVLDLPAGRPLGPQLSFNSQRTTACAPPPCASVSKIKTRPSQPLRNLASAPARFPTIPAPFHSPLYLHHYSFAWLPG